MSISERHRATLDQLRADYQARADRPGTSDGARRVALAAAEAIGALVGRERLLDALHRAVSVSDLLNNDAALIALRDIADFDRARKDAK